MIYQSLTTKARATQGRPSSRTARFTSADVVVVGLVGERGREVKDFLEKDLGTGLARSVVVVSTSDAPPLVRLRAGWTALPSSR